VRQPAPDAAAGQHRGEDVRPVVGSALAAVMGQLAWSTGKPVTWEQVQGSNFLFGPPPEEASFQTRPPVVPDASGNYPLPRPGATKML
jgi:hypothetical protein